MDPLSVIFAVVVIIISVVLSIVGVQVFLVLLEVRKTLAKLNKTLDTVETQVNLVVKPLQNLGGMAQGLGAGMKVFEAFVSWLNKDKVSK
ncbi:MAG: hypothetical protein ABFQ62_00035 [Patescibacteria group bacterium]